MTLKPLKWCLRHFQSFLRLIPPELLQFLLSPISIISPFPPVLPFYAPPPPPPARSASLASYQSQDRGGGGSLDFDRLPRRKALLISCTYLEGSSKDLPPLPNCWRDSEKLRELLIQYGWQKGDITSLSDTSQDRSLLPTRHNLILHLKQLVCGALPGDLLFIHYSGHASQAEAKDDDRTTEYILPCDFLDLQKDNKNIWFISDTELRELLVDPLPKGCKLIALFDCCNSGTLLKLPYDQYSSQETLIFRETTARHDAASNASGVQSAGPERTLSPPPTITSRESSLRERGNYARLTFLPDPTLRISLTAEESGERSDGSGESSNISRMPLVYDQTINGDILSISSCAGGKNTFETAEGGIMVSIFCNFMSSHLHEPVTLRELEEHLKENLYQAHEKAKQDTGEGWDLSYECPVPQFRFAHETSMVSPFTLTI